MRKNRKISQYITWILCMILTLVLGFTPVSAKEGIHYTISPVMEFLDLTPNTTIDKEISVDNSGDVDLHFTVYASGYSVTDYDGDPTFNEDSEYSALQNWITFKNADDSYSTTMEGTIPSGESIKIAYRIQTPDIITVPAQYASIFVESTSDNTENSSGSSIQANTRLGLIIIGKTDTAATNNATIVSHKINSFLLGDKVSVASVVENSGNVHVDAIQTFRVESLSGETLYEYDNARIVMPNKTLKLLSIWDETPQFGIFRVTSSISVLNEEQSTTQIVVVVSPAILVLLFIIFFLIAGFVIISVKKHKGRKKHITKQPKQKQQTN